STLEFEAGISSSSSYVSFRNRARCGGVERMEGVLGLYMEAVDVVQVAVVGFADHGSRPPISVCVRGAMFDAPCDHGIVNNAHAVGVGDHDRAVEKSGIVDPGAAGKLSSAIEREPAGKDLIRDVVLATRKDGGDSCADGAHANLES